MGRAARVPRHPTSCGTRCVLWHGGRFFCDIFLWWRANAQISGANMYISGLWLEAVFMFLWFGAKIIRKYLRIFAMILQATSQKSNIFWDFACSSSQKSFSQKLPNLHKYLIWDIWTVIDGLNFYQVFSILLFVVRCPKNPGSKRKNPFQAWKASLSANFPRVPPSNLVLHLVPKSPNLNLLAWRPGKSQVFSGPGRGHGS